MSSEKEKSENMKQEVNGTQSNAILIPSNSEELNLLYECRQQFYIDYREVSSH